MSARIRIAVLALALLAGAAFPGLASAAAPVWRIGLSSQPTNLPPEYSLGEADLPEYAATLTNIGTAPSSPATLTLQLPAGIVEHGTGEQTVTRSVEEIGPGNSKALFIPIDVALSEGATVTATATISGGGATSAASTETTSTVSSALVPFGLLPGHSGLSGSLTNPEGAPTTQAGSHPYQLDIDLGFPSKQVGTNPGGTVLLSVDGGPRDIHTILPAGMVVNPAGTAARCTEAQFESEKCPDASIVGAINIDSVIFGNANVGALQSPFFNMVPGPGEAAQFGFEPISAGIFAHLAGGVRAGDYALQSVSHDTLSLLIAQVFGARVQLWGDPSDPRHDLARGTCLELVNTTGECKVEPHSTPFLSMSTSCRASQTLEAMVNSWNRPADVKSRAVPLTDQAGVATGVSGCDALHFEPTLEARPTTTSADSPSGLSVDLHVPQSEDVATLATAHLRKAVVALPEGLVLNPSSANGLAGCSSAQVGIDLSSGVANENRPTCPDASRIGEAEVISPLLDHALPGSIYVATPYNNPFDSLLAIYVVINDPQSGVLIKLAGHVEGDPNTGQLITTFDNNPQLPFNDFKLNFFGGSGGVLRTPSVCGTYSTTSQMTPWSAPQSGPPATPHDDYAISADCAQSEGSEPNAPEFAAGTVAPIAGKYTPFVIHLRREDGSQQFSSLSVTPPPGLLGKLAGIPYCPDAALAAAAQKSGNAETQSPSCPAASQIGSVHVAAGAGPAPYWTQGHAYLAGPYNGAPLSMAIVVPATAGPYDLGTVVNRVALRVDPETTQITAESDPIPHILAGIPLDVRQVEVAIDKDQFTRTGSSCDPMAVKGDLVSLLGQSAALSVPYQLANCTNLRFRPSLSLRLSGQSNRGGHPALRATLKMPEASAGIAKASVALPHSEFLDQAHIGTVCTRVQYAAGAGGGSQCPPASVYGHATAWSPLLDQPLSGPVFLRSSNHELPDLVVSLDGQIHVDLDGRVDSIKGGIRNTFEAVPDAPVTKFVLTMQGAKKGLLQNSTNICKGTHEATVSFDAQNGAAADLSPPLVGSKCKKHARSHKRHGRHGR